MKKQALNFKLSLQKKTIISLQADDQRQVQGGATYPNCSAIDACPSALGCSVALPCQGETFLCQPETVKRCPTLLVC